MRCSGACLEEEHPEEAGEREEQEDGRGEGATELGTHVEERLVGEHT